MGSGKWITATVIIIVVVAVFAYVIYQTPGIGKPKEVTLTGTVIKTGEGNTPLTTTFTSNRDNSTYVAAVSGGNPGTYSINLPNEDSYSVTITYYHEEPYASYLNYEANADGGTLNLDTFEQSIERNWAG